MKPTFFETPAEWRTWLAAHHATAPELLVGFHKTTSGRPSITWPESVDEALCFGWIDGVRKRVDDRSYTIRFSPRKPGSIWSAINIRRVQALTDAGRMQPAGLRAFAARRADRSGIYSYEQRSAELGRPYAGMLRKDPAAWSYFHAQPPSYRKAACWWVMSAKKEETRLKRLRQLIADSSAGRWLARYTAWKPAK